jgi:superfamily I DNA/RNA helicase
MNAFELTAEQRAAVEAPFDTCFAIRGAPGTGKTTALMERLALARQRDPSVDPLVVTTREGFAPLAMWILELAGVEARLVDDAEAESVFAEACAPLFAVEWDEFARSAIDPEVPGLRSPDRFLESAFRLVRKLRDALISPSDFLTSAQAGATEFYARPPNFVDTKLLVATKEAYRDSLDVQTADLHQQHAREIDLAKILSKLYANYLALGALQGRLSRRDAVATAIEHLARDPELATQLRDEYGYAFVDGAEAITGGELRLLESIFGEPLAGVTFAGDPSSAIGTFRGARPDETFKRAAAQMELHHQHRSPLAIELACRRMTMPAQPIEARDVERCLTLHRAATQSDEAAFVAQRVAGWLNGGAAPGDVAIVFPSVKHVELYENALLDRDVPVIANGDTNPFADRRALDALALLWNVVDPFRHDWLLRTLANPAWALSDASLATLCSEPPSPQAPLFVLDDEPAPTVRASRWDAKRDLRLGWNVVRGEQDAALSDDARARIERFRALRATWLTAMTTLPFEEFARLVWRDGLAHDGPPGSARARAQEVILQRLLQRLTAFLARNPGAIAIDALEYAQERAASDLETCSDEPGTDFVHLLDVEATRGRSFEHVAIPNVRAGAFPAWYVPDAFLYSPKLGMIPKETAGEARAARTAKFTYYMHRTKTREAYNAEGRRALAYALRRAKRSALVTASAPATRGVAAPELLEELSNARLPGSEIVP